MKVKFLYISLFGFIGVFYLAAIKYMAILDNDFVAIYLTWLVEIGNRSGIHFSYDSYSMMLSLVFPLISSFEEDINVVYAFRIINALIIILISLQLYLLMKIVVQKYVALCSIAVLLLTTVMYTRGIDIRPDVFVLFIWLQIILMLAHERSLGNVLRMFIVGFLYGLGFLFKAKSLIITAPMIILFYGGCIHSGMPVLKAIRSLLSILIGCFVALTIYFLRANINGLDEVYNAGIQLIYHSLDNDDDAGLKSVVIFNAIKADFGYWLFFIFGCYIVAKNYSKYQTSQLLLFMAVFTLIVLSVVINPHYYAYNLVSLYSLMLIISCIYIKIPLDKSFFSTNKVKIVSALLISSYLMIKAFVGIVEVTRYTIDHQLALNKFIKENVNTSRSIYAYGNIDRVKWSQVHWVGYAHSKGNKANSAYNVWKEIKRTSPVLVILNYKMLNKLSTTDRKDLFEHYAYLTPQILTPGISTQGLMKGRLFLSGRYKLTNSEEAPCRVDDKIIEHDTILRLKRGRHTLESSKGRCALKFNFDDDAVNTLMMSNPNMLPYLVTPRS